MVSEEQARRAFEEMHRGRDLTQHHMRGTYVRPHIAALWNQHIKTIRWLETVNNTDTQHKE